jgi:uncharacterized Rossmann fold enzyme
MAEYRHRNTGKKITVLPHRKQHVIRLKRAIDEIKEEEKIIKSIDISSSKSQIVAVKRKNVYFSPAVDQDHQKVLETISRRYEKITTLEPIYLGETIYIVGGGPSLKGFDFERLKGKIVIAVNKALYHVPFAQVLYWSDQRFYEWYGEDVDKYNGIKVTNKPQPKRADIINLVDTGKDGLELEAHAIRHGGNSGYAAINVAYHLGARKIVLLGFDMQNGKGGESHFHEGYPTRPTSNEVIQSNMLPSFDTLVDPLKRRKVEIYNLSSTSLIKCFQRIDLETALSL